MNQPTADSQKFDIVCMSFGENIEKGIEVKSSGEKDSLFETMEIKAGDCKAKDILSEEQIETLKAYRKARRTVKSLIKKESQR